MKQHIPIFIKLMFILAGNLYMEVLLAAQNGNLSALIMGVTVQVMTIARLLSTVSYVTGVGFALNGILQFKAHKENPQQIPLSKPVVTIIVAACLLFLPSVLGIAGTSLFGSEARSAATAAGMNRDLSGL